MWQVQIYNSEVGEWYGWAHTSYDPRTLASVKRAAADARRFCWKTRIVRVG